MTPGPRDRAAVVTAAAIQILERALLAGADTATARGELEALLRDEFADVARQAVSEIREGE